MSPLKSVQLQRRNLTDEFNRNIQFLQHFQSITELDNIKNASLPEAIKHKGPCLLAESMQRFNHLTSNEYFQLMFINNMVI